LRDENKSRTRRALREAALKLFATKGYDETTTEEIAERAGVSARTFFRYFPTKESVLWLRERDWVEAVMKAFLGQPRSLSDWEAMRRTLIEAVGTLARGRPGLLLFQRAVASSPTLRGRAQDHQQRDIKDLAETVAARRHQTQPDESCLLLASLAIITYRRALDVWLASPASVDPTEVLEEEFSLLSAIFRRS
jgi:AcrR family transcriptional regulator